MATTVVRPLVSAAMDRISSTTFPNVAFCRPPARISPHQVRQGCALMLVTTRSLHPTRRRLKPHYAGCCVP